MTSNGHFCLAFFAKDQLKENFRQQFFDDFNSTFLDRMKAFYDSHDAWAEVHIHGLFNPENPNDKEKLCFVGEYLLNHFRDKMGNNDGLILFSHTVPKPEPMVQLLGEVIQNDRFKKIYFVVLDEDSYVEPSPKYKDDFSVRVASMPQVTLHISEFQRRLNEIGYEFETLFEIVKYRL